MSDHTDRLRKHVASYKTMSSHRQNCLDVCDEIERQKEAGQILVTNIATLEKRIAELEAEAKRNLEYAQKFESLANDNAASADRLQADNERLRAEVLRLQNILSQITDACASVDKAALKGVESNE